MTYKFNNNIRVFFEKESKETIPQNLKKPTEEKISKEQLSKATNELLEGFLKQQKMPDAMTFLGNKRQEYSKPGKFNETINVKINTLIQWATGSSIFDKNGSIQPISIDKLGQIAKSIDADKDYLDKLKGVMDFRAKQPIEQYKTDLLNQCVNHPQLSKYSSFLSDKRKEIEALPLGKQLLSDYLAVIGTLEGVIKTKEFNKNTGLFTNLGLMFSGKEQRKEDYLYVLNNALKKAIQTGNPVVVEFNSNEWKKASPDAERYMQENTPKKIESEFIDFIKKQKRSRKDVSEYINNLEQKLKSFNIPLSLFEPYNQAINKLRLIATNEVIYSGDTNISQWWNNTTLDKYLKVAEENKGKIGTIGYSNGDYKFISLDSMKADIIKGPENINITAWKSYIEGLGSFSNFGKIFGEDALDSVAIYLSNMSFKSKLVVNNAFGDYMQSYHSTRIIGKYNHTTDVGATRLEDFARTKILVPDLKLPENYKGGAINPFDLLRNATKGASLEEIIKIKDAIDKDLQQAAENAKKNKEQALEKLKNYKNFTEVFGALGIPMDKNIKRLTDMKLSYSFSKNDSDILLKLIATRESQNKGKTQDNATIQEDIIIDNLKKIIIEQIKKDNATTSLTASKTVKAPDLPKVLASQQAQNVIIKSAEVKTNQDNQIQNIQSQKTEISTDLLKEYNLPNNLELLIKPNYWNVLIEAIAKLETKPTRTEKENQLLTTLNDIKKLHVQKAKSIVEMNGIINNDASLKDVLEGVKQNNDAFSTISKSDSQIYEHIGTFQDKENPNGSKTEKLIDLPVGKTISFSNLSDNNLVTSSINVNGFIGGCSIEKTGVTDCTIYFPEGSGINPIVGVPIKGVGSFMEQANTYSNLNCPSIIELIPFINDCISKKTGKNTNSFDGTFDSFESQRNIRAIAQILGIEYSPIEGIDTFTKNLKGKFPTTNSINSRLIERGILKPEGGFNKLKLEAQISSINF